MDFLSFVSVDVKLSSDICGNVNKQITTIYLVCSHRLSMRNREARMYLLIDIDQERKRKTTHLSEALHKERQRQSAQQALLTDLERLAL